MSEFPEPPVNLFQQPRQRLGLSCCWPFFLHFVLKASKLERRPCYPFVQADMLSACIEYKDILSAITYGVSIWREITYTAATNTLTNDYTVSVGKMEIKQNKLLYKKCGRKCLVSSLSPTLNMRSLNLYTHLITARFTACLLRHVLSSEHLSDSIILV